MPHTSHRIPMLVKPGKTKLQAASKLLKNLKEEVTQSISVPSVSVPSKVVASKDASHYCDAPSVVAEPKISKQHEIDPRIIKLTRSVFFFCNLLILSIGIAATSVGYHFVLMAKSFATAESEHMFTVATIAFLSSGIVCIIFSIISCCGIIMFRPCCVFKHILLLSVMVLMFVISSVCGFQLIRIKNINIYRKLLTQVYNDDEHFQGNVTLKDLDAIQKFYQCCGINLDSDPTSGTGWKIWQTQYPVLFNQSLVPESCCKKKSSKYHNEEEIEDYVNKTACLKKPEAWNSNICSDCGKKLAEWIYWKGIIIACLSLTFAYIICILTIMAWAVACIIGCKAKGIYSETNGINTNVLQSGEDDTDEDDFEKKVRIKFNLK